MRIATLMVALAVAGVGATAFGEQVASTQGVTQEVPVASGSKVLVLAFDQMGGVASNYDWIGRAVQQNLVTELGRLKAVSPIAPAVAGSRPAGDAKAAVEAGKSAGAD